MVTIGWRDIMDGVPVLPDNNNAVALAFSGGDDSRTLAHVVKQWFEDSPYNLELCAIDTGLGVAGWRGEVESFAKWVGLPVSFWQGEGRKYYSHYVENFGFPGNVAHSQIQNRLKGRAFRKMYQAKRSKPGGVVWILSGLRKYESLKRRRLQSPYSRREGCLFINPLFYWTNAKIVDYMIAHNIPLSPHKQGDCKCGATAPHAKEELADIKQGSPELFNYLCGLKNPMPWGWGEYSRATKRRIDQIQAGQLMLFDDNSIESFPVCLDCNLVALSEEAGLLNDW